MISGGLRTKEIKKKSHEKKPLITVITVVYNGVDVLEQTILSVISQHYDNIEYIIIDGASTDGTLDVIKKYEDKIDYWQSEPDAGIYDAMNKGIDLSSGDWINFMNAGDCFHDSNSVGFLSDAGLLQYDVIYGDSVMLDGEKKNLAKSKTNTNLLLLYPIYRHGASFVKGSLHKENKFNISKKELEFALDYDTIYSLKIRNYIFHKVDKIILDFQKDGVSNNALKQCILNYKITHKKKPILSFIVFIASLMIKFKNRVFGL